MPTYSSSTVVSRLAVAASIAALSLSAAVAAQASNWTGSGTDANWSTAENWDVAVDESSGVAAFPYGTSGDSVVDKDYTLSSLSFLNGADAIRLSVAEGKTLSAGDRVRIASEDYSTGVVEVVSGKINMTGEGLYIARLAGIWYYTDAWRVHENAVGTLRILGGEITDAGSPSIAHGRASRGLIDMRGGSFTFANEMFLGLDTDGRGEGRLELTGGAITGGCVHVGRDAGYGVLVVDGGTFTVNNTDWWGSFNLGWGNKAAGVAQLKSGTISAQFAAIGRSQNATGRLEISGGEFIANRGFSIGHDDKNENGIASGEVVMTGGKLTVTADGDFNIANGSYSSGEMTVSGGVVYNDRSLRISCNSNASGRLTITGGAWTNTANYVRVGDSDGSTGYLTVTGGEFYSEKRFCIGNKAWDGVNGGTGVLTVGGTGVVEMDSTGDSYMCFGGAGGTIRLDKGGRLRTHSILRDNNANGMIEFNGGEFVKSGNHPWVWSELIDKQHSIRIFAGGMVFDTNGSDAKFRGNVTCVEGSGGITKRGSGKFTFDPSESDGKSCAYNGPIYVEEGTLEFSSNVYFPEFIDIIRVAEGATLTLPSAVTCRILDNKGTVNGTVTVEADAETKVMTKAVWTGAAEDGDLFNNKNYIAYDQNGRVMYEQTITAATPIEVVYTDGVPSFAGFENVTRVIADDLLSEGYAVPAVVKTAVAWYDPSDDATLTLDEAGKVTGIANKGTAGAALNANAQFSDNCATADGAFTSGGRQALKFVNNRGYISAEPISITSGQDRTLFTVTERKPNLTEEDCQQMFPVELQAGGDWDGVGAFALSQWPWYNAHLRTYYYDPEKVNDDQSIGGTREEKVEFGGGNSADTSYILCGYATNMWIGGWSCGADGTVKPGTDIESHLSQLDQNNNEKSLKVILGQRLENPAPSEGLLGETLVFTNALTTAETEAVRTYLKAKWFDPQNPMPDFDSLVVNAQVDLGGATRTFEKLSGSGSFVDGTVVLTGDLVVTVNPDQSVVVPTFDRLVLGENARLVVNGAKNLPTRGTINILSFTSLEGEFSSVVGDRSTRVILRYSEDHVSARRDAGLAVMLR